MWQRINTRFFLSILLSLASYSFAQSQSFRAQAEVDSLHLMIGSPLQLTLSVEHPSEQTPILPDYEMGGKLGKLEVLKVGDLLVQSVGSYQKASLKLQLTAFDSGYFYLPVQPIAIIKNGVEEIVANTDSILVRFDYPVVDTTQAYKPIKGIYAVPLGLQDLWPWLLGGLVLILFVGGITYLIYRSRQKEEIQNTKVPKLPPHEIAMRKLSQLEASRYWQQGRAREYYFELSYILREYLEGQFQVLALESTTEDILGELQKEMDSNSQIERLRGLLQMAELAKFAKFEPIQKENLDNMDLARKFVKETQAYQKEEVVSEGNEADPASEETHVE